MPLSLSGVEDPFICLVDSICQRGRGTLRPGIRTLFCFPKRFTLSATFKKWLYAGTLALPVLYFSLALFLLAKYGEGAMVSRYGHLLLEGGLRLADGVEKHLPKSTLYYRKSFHGQEKWDISF